jgi:hypothetical protein
VLAQEAGEAYEEAHFGTIHVNVPENVRLVVTGTFTSMFTWGFASLP